jgi:hypothetical protein
MIAGKGGRRIFETWKSRQNAKSLEDAPVSNETDRPSRLRDCVDSFALVAPKRCSFDHSILQEVCGP